MGFLSFSRSYDDLMRDAEAALQKGDAKGAIKLAQKAALDAGKRHDFAAAGDAYVVVAEASEKANAPSTQQVAALALTMVGESSPRRARGIALVRRHSDLAADAPDIDVVVFAWELDSLIKLSQGDLQGAVTAMQQACGLLAVAYGADNAKQASVLSRCGGRMLQAGVGEKQPQLLLQIAEDGLKRVRKGGVTHIAHVNLLRIGMHGAIGAQDLGRAREMLVEEIGLIAADATQRDSLATAKKNLEAIDRGIATRAAASGTATKPAGGAPPN